MAKLTKAYIDRIQPPDRDYKIHWDDTVKGYGVRVMPTGKRVFIAQGRVRGRAVIFTIGNYGIYTEDKARAQAQKVLQGMREGIDPRDARREEDAAKVTLREVADACFARPGKLKSSTQGEMDRHVTRVFAKWEHRPIASITEDEVRKRHRELAKGGLHGDRPAPSSPSWEVSGGLPPSRLHEHSAPDSSMTALPHFGNPFIGSRIAARFIILIFIQ